MDTVNLIKVNDVTKDEVYLITTSEFKEQYDINIDVNSVKSIEKRINKIYLEIGDSSIEYLLINGIWTYEFTFPF